MRSSFSRSAEYDEGTETNTNENTNAEELTS